ncbi:MAG: hypothetical protein IPO02_10740 [Bacteroidetes bacterium]|nr:hypothetical protein [Bacteroidota bacterium]
MKKNCYLKNFAQYLQIVTKTTCMLKNVSKSKQQIPKYEKIIHTLFFMCIATSVSFAQKSSLGSQANSERAKRENIKSCPELQQQLTALYGENFKLDDAKVISIIQKNIKDDKASPCVRKNSLYVMYGEKYVDHLDLISTKSNK